MRRYFYLLYGFFKMSFMKWVEYRFDFFVWAFQNIGWFIVSLLTLEVVFSRATVVAGWTKYEVMTLYGIYLFITTVWEMLLSPNITQIPRHIQSGELDHMLLKPIPIQFLVSFRIIATTSVFNLLIAIIFTIHFARLASDSISLASIVLTLLLIANSIVILYSIMLMFATSAFWLTRLQALRDVYLVITQGGRYPVTFFRRPLDSFFTYVVPLMIMFTIPVQALVKTVSVPMIVTSFALGALFFLVSRAFFNFGIKHYNSASS